MMFTEKKQIIERNRVLIRMLNRASAHIYFTGGDARAEYILSDAAGALSIEIENL